MSETIKIEIVGIKPFRKAVEDNKGRIHSIIENSICGLLRQDEQDFNQQMVRFISLRTPFSPRALYSFFKVYGSWDKALIACGYAIQNGIGALDSAWIMAEQNNPGMTTEELYKIYARNL